MSALLAIFLSAMLYPEKASASHAREQYFDLKEGWNALYLDVDPLNHDPASVFSNSPVDIAASYDGATFTQQFTSDPGANMLNQLGWGVWYAPTRADAFLSDLGAIYGKKAYLVHATSDFVLSVNGNVSYSQVDWNADDYNLVGFTLDQQAAPTFSEFFAGSPAHRNSPIYRLENGLWKKVFNPDKHAMKSGEAFWIYCDGASSYQGPIEVTSGVGGVLAIKQNKVNELVLKNCTEFPLFPKVEHVVSGNDSIPLAIEVDVLGEERIKSGTVDLGSVSWEIELAALEVGERIRVPLTFTAEKMTQPTVNSLLCIKSDLGTETWIPVVGTREDLK